MAASIEENGASEEQGHGHFFVKKTFHKPTYCHHCTDMLWGLIGQGYICEVCNFVVHDRCLKTVVSPCSSIATNLIKNPVAHCWSEPGHFKRKFCNVCRKRLEDSCAIRCEICEYYAHLDCQDFVVSDCKECATYVPNKDLVSVVQFHHWREGNLPGNSKCLYCKKTCWSSECLTGMRCEWCGMTAHAACMKYLPMECNFGIVKDIVLPASSLTIPRMDVSMETILGIQRKADIPKRTVSEEWSSSGDSKTGDDEERKSPKEKEPKEKDKDKDEGNKMIKVFDGNCSMKKRMYRIISVPRHATMQQVVEAALRTFHISDDPQNYYISEAMEAALQIGGTRNNDERKLEDAGPVKPQLRSEAKRPSIFLRYKEKDPDQGCIRVYPGGLRNAFGPKDIPVTKDTTADEVIQLTMERFCMDGIDPEHFNLIEVSLDKGVSERKMEGWEKPFQILQTRRKESLRQNRMTRFYIQQKEDPHGPSIAIYVGNLPTSLAQRQYEKILIDILGKENRWCAFDVIYYEYGSLVLTYTSSDKATRAFNILRNASFDDKQLLVMLLPNIQSHMIPENTFPLLVFVNVKSGGCQGLELIRNFRKLLNPHQVFNLENGGPLPGLYVLRNVPYYRILVCGGDGTVGWVLSCLDNVGQDALCQSPPMGIVPLGTGNDLARVLRWGPGFTGGEDPLNVLRDVIDAEEIQLDRWTVIFHPNEKEQDETKKALANDCNVANTNEDPTTMFVMNNYFGLGIDADLCLDFHNAREENPDKFNSRFHNKGVYVKMAVRKMVNRRRPNESLNRAIRVEVDGRPLDLPPVEGIVILNILRYSRLKGFGVRSPILWASGANPWGPQKEDQFQAPTHYDGMLEIVGVTGVVHMGQIQSGLRSAIRIAQAAHIRITLFTDVPVQVDGEPWIQPAGQVVVLRSALKATMLKKTKSKIKRRNTEPSIFFPSSGDQLLATSPDSESGPY